MKFELEGVYERTKEADKEAMLYKEHFEEL